MTQLIEGLIWFLEIMKPQVLPKNSLFCLNIYLEQASPNLQAATF
jgi:hypothetical protein